MTVVKAVTGPQPTHGLRVTPTEGPDGEYGDKSEGNGVQS